MRNLFRVSCLGLSVLFFGLLTFAQATTLTDIRVGIYPQKIRVVFDFEGQAFYGVTTSEGAINLNLLSCEAGEKISSLNEINDWVIRQIEVSQNGPNLSARIPLDYPVSYRAYPLGSPSRLVLDFDRTFTKIRREGRVAEGLEYQSIVKGMEDGYVTAQVLNVDPKKVNIFPMLAGASPGFLESVVEFFSPWVKRAKHFSRAQVSKIATEAGAAAGVNGTFFSYTGRPLGILMAFREILSYPISDRTALILTSDNRAFIDRMTLDSFFEINGNKYKITGINQPRTSKDIVIYTRYYGETTDCDRSGFEITVEEGHITGVSVGNSRIPEKGYVISAGSLYAEYLPSILKTGDSLHAEINLIPYSMDLDGEIMHVIGGGPMLLKKGRIYISKYEEKFQPDVRSGRAARTAVGIDSDGKLMFITVDGKPRYKAKGGSLGLSLTELAYLLQSLGAVEAINLDGGSSTTMVISGQVVNRPVAGYEQKVSNAVLLSPK